MKRLLDVVNDPVFQELKKQHPQTSAEAIETLFQFLKVATFMNIKRESLFTNNGLTSARFHLLMILKREPNLSLSPSELARRIGVSRGTMTQFIDAIEKEQLAERIEDPHDKRGMQVRLTEKGEQTINQVLPDYFSMLEKITEVLTVQDRQHWLEIMEKLVEGLSHVDD